MKRDWDTNLNDPRSEVDRSDCNLRLVWSLMEQKIEFLIAKSWFRLNKRKATIIIIIIIIIIIFILVRRNLKAQPHFFNERTLNIEVYSKNVNGTSWSEQRRCRVQRVSCGTTAQTRSSSCYCWKTTEEIGIVKGGQQTPVWVLGVNQRREVTERDCWTCRKLITPTMS